MRCFFNHVSNIYDQLRLKALAVLAGEVAIVTFMFTDKGIAIPDAIDSRIFFFAGVLLLCLAFASLLWTIAPLEWKIPYDQYSSENLKKFKTQEEFLEYLNDDYCIATRHCLPLVSHKARRFTWTIYMLATGVIILMVIKYGG